MSIPVVINGTTYNLPQQGDTAPWGAALSSILNALVTVANTSAGPGSILSTTFAINNNVTAPTNITGLSFDSAKVTTAQIYYSIKRSTTTTNLVERGIILVEFNSGTSAWNYSLTGVGDAGITFSVTSGQFAYTSSNLSGTGHACTLSFSALAFG